jgi:hypothetical protein
MVALETKGYSLLRPGLGRRSPSGHIISLMDGPVLQHSLLYSIRLLSKFVAAHRSFAKPDDYLSDHRNCISNYKKIAVWSSSWQLNSMKEVHICLIA